MRLPQVLLGLTLLPVAGMVNAQTAGSQVSSSLPPNASVIPSPVKSAPFSADVITEYDRALDLGNHIHRATRGRVFRDDQGRVRTETQTASPIGGIDQFQHITIQDPVLRVVIHLDPHNKTATVHHCEQNGAAVAAGNPAISGARTGNAILTNPANASGQGSGQVTSIPLQRSQTSAVHSETMGSRTLEGLAVIGTRTSRTIEDGGAQPVVSVTESWFSRDLHMVILTETDDGQSGHSTMRVVDIVRVEPSAQLFQIPADYTIKDTNPATASAKH